MSNSAQHGTSAPGAVMLSDPVAIGNKFVVSNIINGFPLPISQFCSTGVRGCV
jgi:hypothetical protein